jgi:DNA modification methylase
VTSPPYFGLRDYGTGEWEGGEDDCDHIRTTQHRDQPDRPKGWDGAFRHTSQPLPVTYSGECGMCGAVRVDRQIGLEPTPDEFVAGLVEVFRGVRRVLKDDGTVWLNLGDSYNADGRKGLAHMGQGKNNGYSAWVNKTMAGTKPKDLLGIPWMVAFALRADGWYLRSEVIWHKPNPMPESVTDRPTKSHEQVFLLAKSPRYYYDADAIKETASYPDGPGNVRPVKGAGADDPFFRTRENTHNIGPRETRNKRTVWTVPSSPFAGAHFATFPPALILPCILAGCPEGGTVLDPFNGAGTTGMVALRNNRSYVGIELNPEYAELARNRIRDDAPLLNTHTEAA